MELTVQNVYGLILRSKLLSIDEAKAMYARWQEEAKDARRRPVALRRLAGGQQVSHRVPGVAAGARPRRRLLPQRLQDPRPPRQGPHGRRLQGAAPLGQIVAIKVLPPSRARSRTCSAASSARPGWPCSSSTPTSSAPSRSARAGGLHYLVMEYLEGETLEDVLAAPQEAAAGRGGAPGLPGAAGLAAHPRAGPGPPRPQAGQPDAGRPAPADTTPAATVKILDIGLGRALFDEASDGSRRWTG